MSLIWNAKHTDEINSNYCIKMSGIPSLEAYKQSSSSYDVVRYIPVPALCINSADDDVIPLNSIPREGILANPNCIQLIVQGGGHLEYFSTWKRRRWAYDTVLDYFDYIASRDAEDDKEKLFSE